MAEVKAGKTTTEGLTKVQRNYKDTVSRMLFQKPENALSLYNALNGTDYTDASQITFNMLDNAIYMGMQNDISFLIINEVNLYEHQSTYNLNMPLRDLFYVAELLQVYVKDQSLYSSKLIKLPTTHFVVFYNGVEEKPEKRILRLSEAFEVQTDDPELEQAVEEAIEYCVRHDILKDFLLKQRAEVVKMSIFEYDEEREIELIRRDEREIGAQKERQKAEQELKKERQRAQAEMDKNRENTIRSIISICKEMGGDQEVVAQKLMKNCNLNEEQAKEKVALYWE